MNARTSWSARLGRRSSQGKQSQNVTGGSPADNLPLDDLLEARFDDDGRLAQIGRGNRQRVAERLDPRPPSLNAAELERAVQKLARGLEAIERQGGAKRPQATPSPAEGPSAPGAAEPAGREVVTDGLDRLEARLDALSRRLQQRLASVENEGAPSEPQPDSNSTQHDTAPTGASPQLDETSEPAEAILRPVEPSLAVDLRRDAAPARARAAQEPQVTWGRLEPLTPSEPGPATVLPAPVYPVAVEAPADRAAELAPRPRPELKQQFAALEARIASLQHSFGEKQIQPVRDELVGLLRHVENVSRDGRSIAGAVEQVRAKLDEVETKVSAARNMTGNRLGELHERLAGLSERLGEIESEVPGFEALRDSQIAILERFDRMEDLVQRVASPEQLLERVEGLRTELQAVASQREMARVEDQILRIADRIDQLPQHLSHEPAFERMEGQLQALAIEFAEARRQRNSGAGELNDRLAQIGDALHDLGEASRAHDLSGVEQRLAEVTARLADDGRATGETLARLEKRLAALADSVESQEAEASAEILSGITRKMDALAGAIHDQDARGARRDLDGLSRKLDQLHGSLAEHSEHLSRTQTRSLEEQLEQMQGHLNGLVARSNEQAGHFGPFAQKLQEISDRLNGLGAPDGRDPLSARLTAIEDHLAGLARKTGEPRAIHAQLDNIVGRLESLKGDTIDPAHIDALVERVDAAVRASAAQERFDRLEQKLAETSVGGEDLARIEQKLDSGLQASAADERFARLEQRLEELTSAYAAAAGGDGLTPGEVAELSTDIVALRRELRSMPGLADGEGSLGTVLKTISERLDRLPEMLPANNAELEAQIERIAQVLEDPSQNRAALAHMEASLKSIEDRLEETRRSVAERASADQEGGFEPQDIATVADLARGLSDDVNVLKNSAEASDKRTRDALDAVQSTLEAVVKRMAFLEREADAAAAAGVQAPESDAAIAPIPAVLRRVGADERPVPGLAAEPETIREQTGGGLFSRFTSSQLLRRATGGRAESFSPDAEENEEGGDLPLEPGTDSPLNSALTGAPSSDTVRMSGEGRRKGKLSSIGAARAADGSAQRVAPEPVTGEDFLAAARRAAQAAAAEASGPEAEGETGAGRLVGRLKARRRAVLAGALGLALAFAALQFAQSQRGSEPIDLADSAEDEVGDLEGASAVVDLPPVPVPTGDLSAAPVQTVAESATEVPTDRASAESALAPLPEAAADTGAAEAAAELGAESPEPAETGRPVRTVIVPVQNAPGSSAPPVAAAEPTPPPAADAAIASAQPEVQMASAIPGPEPVAPQTAPPEAPPEVTASLSPPTASDPAAGAASMGAPTTGLPEPVGPDRLRQAAAAGDPAAAFEVGARYAEGRGATQDMDAAVAWYQRAAEAGLAPAQYRLGSIYEKGLGVPKDLTKAQNWYRQAAEAGNVKAMHNLAVLHAEGAGGEPDLERAGTLFHQAAEHGVRDSQFNLAILHARGLGVPQDLIEAYKWFAVAASSGDEESVKRRDIIAAAMKEADLAKAKAAVESFKPLPLQPEANEIAMPDGGWGEDTSLQHLYSETDTVALVQKLLAERGYDPGPADGMLGAKTVQAISAFQAKAGLPPSGLIDPTLVAKLQESST